MYILILVCFYTCMNFSIQTRFYSILVLINSKNTSQNQQWHCLRYLLSTNSKFFILCVPNAKDLTMNWTFLRRNLFLHSIRAFDANLVFVIFWCWLFLFWNNILKWNIVRQILVIYRMHITINMINCGYKHFQDITTLIYAKN